MQPAAGGLWLLATTCHPARTCIHPRPLPSAFHPPQELLEKCNPLGMFDAIASLAVAQNMRDLYRLVLVDTPLAPYFSQNLTSEDLDEMNIEVGGCVIVCGVGGVRCLNWHCSAVRLVRRACGWCRSSGTP